MKKLLPLLLALLLLAGCGQQPQQQPSVATQPTQSTGLYEPQSELEQQTGGAVRSYRLEKNNYCSLLAMGNRLLLVGNDGSLTVLQEDTCVLAASVTTQNPNLHTKGQYLDASAQGVAYYVPESRQIVLLNPQLQQVSTTALPEDMQGDPVIDLDSYMVYYCVPGKICALNLQTGISRLIRSHSARDQQLLGSCFQAQVLMWAADGGQIQYISAQDGQTCYEGDGGIYLLYTWQDSYFAGRLDGRTDQLITGTRQGTPQLFSAQQTLYTSALPMGSVVGYTAGSDTHLSSYDLQTGRCTAQVTLSNTADPVAFLATQEALWILTYRQDEQVLCRWELSLSPEGEEDAALSELISDQNPDTEALQTCTDRAEQLSKQYGVKIHVWHDALQVTGGYETVAEYQTDTLTQMLNELETALAMFPEGFLRQTLSAGDIHVNLVRSVDGGAFRQFWQEGDCYITIGCRENVTHSFLYGAGLAIDSHVLGNSRKLDTWDRLNPAGFAYSYSDEPREDLETYLYCEGSVFLEERALSYPSCDRSSVLLFAMTDLGADAFASDAMQEKLLCLCKAIREAYGLEKSREMLPWEQYLHQSIAYNK